VHEDTKIVGVAPNKTTLVVKEPGIISGVGSLKCGNSLLVFLKFCILSNILLIDIF